jgi:general secretion pathway protein G
MIHSALNSSSRKPHTRRPGAASSARGFSLIEILIAIALVALLASVALNQLTGIFGDNQEQAAELFVTSSSELALTRYRLDVGSFPSTEEGLGALLRPPAGKEARWKGPYIKEEPIDPWGNPYQYRYPGTRNVSGSRGYDIWSLGADGTESSDDIGNWSSNSSG